MQYILYSCYLLFLFRSDMTDMTFLSRSRVLGLRTFLVIDPDRIASSAHLDHLVISHQKSCLARHKEHKNQNNKNISNMLTFEVCVYSSFCFMFVLEQSEKDINCEVTGVCFVQSLDKNMKKTNKSIYNIQKQFKEVCIAAMSRHSWLFDHETHLPSCVNLSILTSVMHSNSSCRASDICMQPAIHHHSAAAL